MIIVTDQRVAAFVSDKIGKSFLPPYTCMGIEKDGEIIGGVIFNDFEGADIHVSVAGSGFTRDFMSEVGKYVFGQLGCERITATTEQIKVVRIAERLGGKIEGALRNHFGKGRDAFIVGILKKEYRFK